MRLLCGLCLGVLVVMTPAGSAAPSNVVKKLVPRAAPPVPGRLTLLEEQNKKLEARLATLEKLEPRLRKLEEDAKKVGPRLTALEGALRKLATQLAKSEATARGLTKEVRKLQEEVVDLGKKATASEDERRKEVKRLEALLRKQADSLALENRKLRDQVRALETRLQEQRKAHKNDVAALAAVVMAEMAQRKKDGERIDALTRENEARKADVARLDEWLRRPFTGPVYQPVRIGCAGEVIYMPTGGTARVFATPPQPRAPRKEKRVESKQGVELIGTWPEEPPRRQP